MRRKLLVLDIDGTLTNGKKEITPATHAALDRIRKSGHGVVLASGRPAGGMRALLRELEYERYGGYYISYNGACVTDALAGEDVFRQPLPAEVPAFMQAYAREHGLSMCVHRGGEMLAGTPLDPYLALEANFCGFSVTRVEDYAAYAGVDFYKVLMTGEPEKATRHAGLLAARFGESLSITQSEPYFIEIMARGVTKGSALEGLVRKIGMPMEDVIACGDGANDIPMILAAGVGVAMGNAGEAVKRAADYVTLSNEEDGLLPVIERFIDNQA